jgi:hypothetical protein
VAGLNNKVRTDGLTALFPESHAGDPAPRRGARRLDPRAVGRGQGVAAALVDAIKTVMRGPDKEDVASAASTNLTGDKKWPRVRGHFPLVPVISVSPSNGDA